MNMKSLDTYGVWFMCVWVLPTGVKLQTLEFGTSESGTVKETETKITKVACVLCTSSSPTGRTITYDKVSISPSFNCGNCFDVYRPIDLGFSVSQDRPDEWCVYYLPSQGTLNYGISRVYNMRVSCTDGVQTSYTNVVLKVTTNQLPRLKEQAFINCPTISSSTLAGNVVYNFDVVEDPDDDQLFCSMTTTPENDNFEMDPATCRIRAKNDLKTECNVQPYITFNVNVTDNNSPPIGPIAVTCPREIDRSRQPADVTNLNTTIHVREDVPIDGTAYRFTTASTERVTYTITSADPSQAIGLFRTMPERRLMVNEKLDYENFSFQTVRLEIAAEKDGCSPVSYYLIVNMVEVNEPPVLTPKIYFEEVDEETIKVNPRYECKDEDFGDSCAYSIISGNEDGRFQINRDTGEIYSTTYNIDNNVPAVNRSLEIAVFDERGLNDTAFVNLTIRDINDNRPYFVEDQASITDGITDCERPGVIDAFTAMDDDSTYQGNNIVTFLPARSDCLQIHTDGTVQYLSPEVKPQSCTLQTYAVDQGFNPRQQTSQVQATVTVTLDCRTTTVATQPPAPDQDADADSNANSDADSNSNANADSNSADSTNVAGTDNGLIFGILGGILGALLLASLLACCCRRYGCCKKAKTKPFASDQTVTKKAKKFDGMQKKKKAQAAAAAAAAAAPAAVVAPSLIQRFVKVRRKIPFMRVKRTIPVRTVTRVVPVGTVQKARTVIPVRSAPAPISTVLPAPPYRMSGTAPFPGGSSYI